MCDLKRLRSAFNLAGVLLILFSCAKDPTEVERTPTSTFPLTEGSRWQYEGQKTHYQYENNQPVPVESVMVTVYRNIIGPDTLLEIPDLIVCDDTVTESYHGYSFTEIERSWYKIEEDKLKLFAYDLFIPESQPDPTIFDEPLILLDFPLDRGKTWTNSYLSDTYWEYSVVGIEYLELPGGWQYCDIVRGDLIDALTPSDTLRSIFLWYSDDGLMRYEAQYWINPTDSVRTIEVWELIEMEILEP